MLLTLLFSLLTKTHIHHSLLTLFREMGMYAILRNEYTTSMHIFHKTAPVYMCNDVHVSLVSHSHNTRH